MCHPVLRLVPTRLLSCVITTRRPTSAKVRKKNWIDKSISFYQLHHTLVATAKKSTLSIRTSATLRKWPWWAGAKDVLHHGKHEKKKMKKRTKNDSFSHAERWLCIFCHASFLFSMTQSIYQSCPYLCRLCFSRIQCALSISAMWG